MLLKIKFLYVGNFFGKTNDNNSPTFGFSTFNNTIVGKYFAEDKMAFRGALRLGFGSNSQTVYVRDRGADNTFLNYPAKHPTKENKMDVSYNNIGLAGGLEWRRGNTRLQGFYGGELGVMMGGSKVAYSYGNQYNPNAPIPVTDDADDEFNGGSNKTNDSYGNAARILESKATSFGVGLRGFVGVEYFIIPKLSIGGEFGWGFVFNTSSSSQEIESIGTDLSGNSVVGKQSSDTGKSTNFSLDTDNMNTVFGNAGQLKIIFHF